MLYHLGYVGFVHCSQHPHATQIRQNRLPKTLFLAKSPLSLFGVMCYQQHWILNTRIELIIYTKYQRKFHFLENQKMIIILDSFASRKQQTFWIQWFFFDGWWEILNFSFLKLLWWFHSKKINFWKKRRVLWFHIGYRIRCVWEDRTRDHLDYETNAQRKWARLGWQKALDAGVEPVTFASNSTDWINGGPAGEVSKTRGRRQGDDMSHMAFLAKKSSANGRIWTVDLSLIKRMLYQ